MSDKDKNKDQTETVERSKYVYDLVNSWIGNAENKVSVSCGVFTGAFGVIAFLSQETTSTDNANQCLKVFYNIVLIMSVLLLLVSIAFYVLSINPNLGSSGKKNSIKKYPVYYGDIAKLDLDSYLKLMKDGTEQDFVKEIQTETHYNSEICLRKMKWYRRGLWFSFIAIVMAVLSWVIRAQM